jgi:hypothetical protein
MIEGWLFRDRLPTMIVRQSLQALSVTFVAFGYIDMLLKFDCINAEITPR